MKTLNKKERTAVIRIFLCFIGVLLVNIFGNLYFLIPSGLILSAFVARYAFLQRIKLIAYLPVLFMAIMISLVKAASFGSTVFYKTQVFGYGLNVYNEGILSGAHIFLKILVSTGLIIILFLPIKMIEFTAALSWLKIHEAFIEVFMIAIKYIYVLGDEISTIRKAQRARLGLKGARRSILSAGNAGGMLVLRAFDRSEALSKALKCRGYKGGSLVVRKQGD